MKKNNNTVYICLNIVLLVVTSVFLVYYLAVNEDVDFVRIISAAMVVAGCLLNLTREKRNLPVIDYEAYEEAYEEVLKMYKKALQHDAVNALAWSNMGLMVEMQKT